MSALTNSVTASREAMSPVASGLGSVSSASWEFSSSMMTKRSVVLWSVSVRRRPASTNALKISSAFASASSRSLPSASIEALPVSAMTRAARSAVASSAGRAGTSPRRVVMNSPAPLTLSASSTKETSLAIVPPASLIRFVTSSTCWGSASGAEMTVTVASLRVSPMSSGAAAVTNSFCFSMLPLAASSFVRRSSRSARRASTWLCRDSPIGSLRGPAPRTMPTARARNTETRETRW
ncbi:Uncharacterised protein [Mycobacteroides abscessus subsp. abscessus]|nr:Uncharacterised protein [Mycobacteroides abscessus subsp. abscessus]